tara:strand:+ start:970 stop:1221 length:252 start_codon:yes stop_codon:yes gene_type:complete
MNTSITTTNVTAESLVSLMSTYDDIEIYKVEKITGSKNDITSIISSTKIHGFNSAHFVLTEDIDSETLTIFNASTSGTVQLPS